MKTCCFGESLKTSLRHIYKQKSEALHLYNGQEAVLAGALHAMDLKDRMITAYRNHVQPIGMGVDPKRVMAELLEKLPDF
jgi:pyruvate dehydrogenase E1 component alpha subunit